MKNSHSVPCEAWSGVVETTILKSRAAATMLIATNEKLITDVEIEGYFTFLP